MKKNQKNSDLTIVVFGITGDLVKTKILKAIGEWKSHDIFGIDKIIDPKSKLNLIGVGRKEFSKKDFSDFSKESLADKGLYIQGELDSIDTYKKLKSTIDSLNTNKIIVYIALPPKMVCGVIKNLSDSSVLTKETEWPKLLLEKPFGESTKTADELQGSIHDVINPHQLFIIDHYLHKDLIRKKRTSMSLIKEMHSFYNELSHNLNWKHLRVYFHETKNVENRGAFYDNVGVLSDVVQNHSIQMLTVLFSEQFIVKLLSDLKISPNIIFGQYNGYLKHSGVRADSKTETFAEFTLQTNRGPITFSAGKGMKKHRISVVLETDFKGSKSKTYEWEIADGGISPYAHIFADAVSGVRESFASFEAVRLGWKLVENVKKQWVKEGAKIKRI